MNNGTSRPMHNLETALEAAHRENVGVQNPPSENDAAVLDSDHSCYHCGSVA